MKCYVLKTYTYIEWRFTQKIIYRHTDGHRKFRNNAAVTCCFADLLQRICQLDLSLNKEKMNYWSRPDPDAILQKPCPKFEFFKSGSGSDQNNLIRWSGFHDRIWIRPRENETGTDFFLTGSGSVQSIRILDVTPSIKKLKSALRFILKLDPDQVLRIRVSRTDPETSFRKTGTWSELFSSTTGLELTKIPGDPDPGVQTGSRKTGTGSK